MLGLLSIKSRATDHVFLFSGGKLAHHGAGLSGLLFAPFATAAVVPIDARDDVFAVEGVTADFQTVTIQGLISHRISDPKAAVKRQDFSVALPSFRPHAEPMKQIAERLKAIAQAAARETLARATLDDALTKSAELSSTIMSAIQSDAGVTAAGVGVDRVLVLSIKPAPEIRKALEADIREQLLRKADAAVFERRRAAAADEHDLQLRNAENAAELARAEIADAKELEIEKLSLAQAQAETRRTEAESAAEAERLALAPWAALSPSHIASIALKNWAGANASLSSLSISGDSLEKIANALVDRK